MEPELKAGKHIYAGLFLVTLATLSYEILLTRIFSVTMWYHFAFLSISIVMFGMTLGAILVYLLPGYFKPSLTISHLGWSALLFSITIVLSFLIYLLIPFVNQISFLAFLSLGITYLLISIPFIFSGICVCLALTRFPSQVSKLYATDLFGAGLGCILLVYLLKITDGPTAVMIVAFLSGLGGFCFLSATAEKKLRRSSLVLIIFLGVFSLVNSYLAYQQKSLLRIMWIKGGLGGFGWEKPLFEKWSSYSYISVKERGSLKPFGWALSESYPKNDKVRQLLLTIDGCASTPITEFKGDLKKLEFLKYDLSNLAHYLRTNSKVLVIGAGGGRDVLSALVFGQKSITAVEINSDILFALNQRFGDFSGHLDQIPEVKFVNEEGRIFVATSQEKFDLIQISLIDTWAATAAGAFILTEHSLYTVEAWKEFLNHLSPKGILSVSYWYFPESAPVIIYRMISLARTSLLELGAENPRAHIVIVRHLYQKRLPTFPDGVGTVLISKEPFSEPDLKKIEEVVKNLRFEMVLSPGFSLHPTFEELAEGKPLSRFPEAFLLNLKPTRENSPFFFYALKFQNAFKPKAWKEIQKTLGVGPPLTIFILGALLIIVLGLTFFFILIPLILSTDKKSLRGSFWLLTFFSAIGFGFMLLEISQMQRLIIFLGNPTYGLSVVLLSLLLSSGLGSFLTQGVRENHLKKSGLIRLALLLLVIILFGIFSPDLIQAFRTETTAIRISIALAMLFLLGIFMGMAFPLGMKLALKKSPALTPWLWGINGATSVCASVVGVVIALNSTISATFWTGMVFYALALISFLKSQNASFNQE